MDIPTRTNEPSHVSLDSIRGLATIPVWHRDATVPSACGVLGIGRSLAYRLAVDGELPTIRFGHRVVVMVPALLRMLGETA